jgi:hypothetical protein
MKSASSDVLAVGGPVGQQNGWKVASCYVSGSRHQQQGQNCQDRAGSFVAGPVAAIAVSDGAGSAVAAEVGSAVAVRTALLSVLALHRSVCAVTAENASKIVWFGFQHAQKQLSYEAAARGLTLKDLACTLILVVAGPDFVCAGHAGDGAVVLVNQDDKLITLSKPTNGEFANETALLCCDPNLKVNISRLDGIRPKALAVFTDGLQRLALSLPAHEPHPGFFLPLFRLLEGLTEAEANQLLFDFLNSARVSGRSDDDRTLATAILE